MGCNMQSRMEKEDPRSQTCVVCFEVFLKGMVHKFETSGNSVTILLQVKHAQNQNMAQLSNTVPIFEM